MMASRSAQNKAAAAIVSVCHQGHPPERLKAEVLALLRPVLPVDALWWATSDPATLLFTQAYSEGIPHQSIPYLVNNEFLGRDANQWTELIHWSGGVRSLAGATGGRLELSARFRDVFQPLGLGDELRAVLRSGDDCWGLLCLHRGAGGPFSAEEAQFIKGLAPHLGYGIRAGLLVASAVAGTADDSPGLVVVGPGGEIVAATAAAQAWFAELGHDGKAGAPVPAEVATAMALLRRPAGAPPARLRVRTRAGRWIVLHASFLTGHDLAADQIAIIIEAATPIEVADVIMRANGLTERERRVTGLVCQGRSTAEIATTLWISGNTVQDHLKSVFDKTGVRSRRELIATILRNHYLPALEQSRPVSARGFFQG
jgi:DNA-binding CsgD family transcriptional regulator